MTSLEKIIASARKPITYYAAETNAVIKDLSCQEVTVCLGYPDLYEIGMSNLGIRILYGMLNSMEKVACERFFAPGPDVEAALRNQGIPLFSLESHAPVHSFDLVGFSIASELNYTSLLNLLDLSKIPLYSRDRNQNDPLVLAGGYAAFQPEPLSEYIDLWVVGEGEEAFAEIIEVVRRLKGAERNELLATLANIPGVYIPSFYTPEKSGALVSFSLPSVIEKRIVPNLESSFYPESWITPVAEIVHDRISLEIMRGCPQQCLFCQGGFCGKPVRTRSPEQIRTLARRLYASSGYEEMSLLSFSASDHPRIEEIVQGLIDDFQDEKVAFSFPSLRIDTFYFNLANRIAQIRKTGLTFAPETGRSLRPLIGKEIEDTKLLSLLSEARAAGWRQIKLYFILGLPSETSSIVEEIMDLVEAASSIISVKCSFTTFIPKPHTPFQWEAFPSEEYISAQRDRLFRRFHRNRFVKLSFHPYQMSKVEALLCRGGRELSPVIKEVWKAGATLENWNEHFLIQRWTEALEKAGIHFSSVLGRRSLDSALPWDHISPGKSKEELAAIRDRFIAFSGMVQ